MGAYKQFLASDIIVAPHEVHKGFTFTGAAQLTGSSVNIDRYLGKNITGSLFNTGSDLRTGQVTSQYQRLIYNSTKELYYSNYQTSVYGDPVSRPILVPGRDEAGNRYVGSASNQAYDNYLQSDLTYARYFPTASNALVGVISIPNYLFGDYIQPTSFTLQTVSGSFTDDGEGNIISGSEIVGNIIYPHGIIILTGNERIYSSASNAASLPSAVYASGIYAANVYGSSIAANSVSNQWINNLIAAVTSSNVTCSFSSSYTIYETQYKCTIRENEFNCTLNPSAISGSYTTGSKSGILNDNLTGSYFDPYITTVGLYDEQQNLLAVGKLSQPVPSSPTTDTTIIINLDR